ncbi:MAG: peptidase M23 [Cupriavidus sp.]|uniref:peptidase M23 n=2 Tax=Cupriavidus sp. TaxID=1873897 RepID=UPI0025B977AE|nr:peptidase M23 [Cupriavidus sp.]MCA3194027.1 peptidase M23 [Cupriavidus sp.]
MIISPPFLPSAGRSAITPSEVDPMMAAVNKLALAHGIYPVAFDRRWHCGVHLARTKDSVVHAIADGEVVAYRVCQHAYVGGGGRPDSNAGFVLLRHTTETGEGRTLTFYSLYMHLLELAGYQSIGADVKRLPEFLRMPQAGADPSQVPSAQQGAPGQKVLRKQVLGWVGQCHGQKHLHFEIFMTKKDFDAYFGQTQLGKKPVTTPTGADYWGHSYYVIPPRTTFVALPPGALRAKDGKHKISGIDFDELRAGANADTLYAEAWFHKGNKYTRVWRDAGEGRREELTEQPIVESGYEYDLYKRASRLYPACPSDGYELLRFGRILSTPATLSAAPSGAPPPANPCSTWMRIAFAPGQQGYVDVNHPSVLKLSDADFPFFKGWQKISEGSGPFGNDGLCDIDALKKILKDATARQSPQEAELTAAYEKADVLARYIGSNNSIREQLRGFVCEAPSQWDTSTNEARYGGLKNPGEFYHGKEAGYAKFINFLKSLQFWDSTGLPTGEALWFFHPLAFIEHFRKCGWLSEMELAQIYAERHYKYMSKTGSEYKNLYRLHINNVLRKYAFNDAARSSHFFGQCAIESFYMMAVRECTIRLGEAIKTNHMSIAREVGGYMNSPEDFVTYFSRYQANPALANTDPGDGAKFRGRGFKQLTGKYNYSEYWKYRGWLNAEDYDPAWFKTGKPGPNIPNPELAGNDPYTCVDTAGFFCARYQVGKAADLGVTKSASETVTSRVNPNDVSSLTRRWEETRLAYLILGDQT